MRGRPGRQTNEIPSDGFITIHVLDLRAEIQKYWAQLPPNTSLPVAVRELIQLGLSADPSAEAIFIERRRALRGAQRHIYKSIGPFFDVLQHDFSSYAHFTEEDDS